MSSQRSWLTGWSESFNKRLCRFLIHRYLGHVLKGYFEAFEDVGAVFCFLQFIAGAAHDDTLAVFHIVVVENFRIARAALRLSGESAMPNHSVTTRY